MVAYPTSRKYKNAIRQSGGRKTVVDLYYNRQTTPVLTDLVVYSGSISVDMNAAQRRSGTITLASSALISNDVPLTLEPYGMELGIRMGVVFPNGTEELVPVGKFLITDINWNDGTGVPTVTFSDRSATIDDQSSQIGTEDYGSKSTLFAIQNLLEKSPFENVTASEEIVDPLTLDNKQLNLVVDPDLVDIYLPTGQPMTTPFWQEIQQLALSLGAEIFFYVDGCNVILRKIPTLTTENTDADASFLIDAGTTGILLDAALGLSRGPSYNAVQLTGTLPANSTSTANPPSVFVYDANPNSRTYYFGPFGKKVYVMTSDTVTDKTQLSLIATSKLGTLLGISQSLSFEMLPDPSMEAGDIVKLSYLDGSTELHMVDRFDLDLAWGSSQSVTTLSKQIT